MATESIWTCDDCNEEGVVEKPDDPVWKRIDANMRAHGKASPECPGGKVHVIQREVVDAAGKAVS